MRIVKHKISWARSTPVFLRQFVREEVPAVGTDQMLRGAGVDWRLTLLKADSAPDKELSFLDLLSFSVTGN